VFGFKGASEPSANGGGKPLDNNQAGAVAAASGAVKSKHGGARPGSGRKPGSQAGTGAPRPVAGAPAPNPGQVEAEVSEADIEFCRTIAKAALEILDRVETSTIVSLIKSIDDPYITEKMDVYLRAREITEPDYEVVTNAVAAIAAKYAFLSRYAPEAALLSWACIHGLAFSGVVRDLKKLAAIVKAKPVKGVKDPNGALNAG
jgi:hypothetical protein